MGFKLPDSNSISDSQVKESLERYYEVSKNASAHDDYADLFTSDGEFDMNAKKAKGKEREWSSFSPIAFPISGFECKASGTESRALRKAIWSHVPGRDHSPIQIYTHGNDEYDLMIHGVVKYNHHAGHETGSDWAANVKLAKEGGELKVALYEITVVSSLVVCTYLLDVVGFDMA